MVKDRHKAPRGPVKSRGGGTAKKENNFKSKQAAYWLLGKKRCNENLTWVSEKRKGEEVGGLCRLSRGKLKNGND